MQRRRRWAHLQGEHRHGTVTSTNSAWPPVSYDCGDHVHQCIQVQLVYDYKNHPLMPTFPGFGLAMPDSLTSTYIVEVS